MTSSNLSDAIDHFSINVADIQSSINWYMTSFNCSVLYQDNKQAILQFANVKLALTLPSVLPPHIALARDDAATLGELRKRADGTSSTFISDPTGNPVEIVGVPVEVK